MNKCELIGRLTKEPELKLTANQTQFCNFTIAVDRKYKDANGNRQADFINCLAWKQTAVFIQKYFHKGNKIGICGSIQTRSYDDQNGVKKFVVEVLVEDVDFIESQNQANTAPAPAPEPQPQPQNQPVATAEPESSSGELPFEI
jgi:single-strand DNA-binding protein